MATYSSSHAFCHLLKICCFKQAFGSPYWLTQLPQIRALVDTVHYEGFYLLTYLLTCNLERQLCVVFNIWTPDQKTCWTKLTTERNGGS